MFEPTLNRSKRVFHTVENLEAQREQKKSSDIVGALGADSLCKMFAFSF